ncbi:hypothetical protein ATANTOWER_025812 [Ataeniobius toweri]|uniref:Uncharacterized protein n=1 Tax=Ataeniobius toweri TaxID=208326 RepID=A0ABU7A969_9TELE|nr:hypothetical protein [Ataeniobius toweri]
MPPNAMNQPPTAHGHTPTGELHPQKADEATPTQRKLHTQPRSKHPPRPTHITPHTATARQRCHAMLSQPPPTGAKGQTPSSTELTMEPPTPLQDGTNSPG